MDVRKIEWSVKNDASRSASTDPLVKIAFLGTRPLHVILSFVHLEKMSGIEFIGFYEEVELTATQLALELPISSVSSRQKLCSMRTQTSS